MTSILNNMGAMVALTTLRETNNNLLETQTQIATGKKVDSAAQNAAIWAVTTVMEADVDGFNAISESLSLGKATVTVARNAAEKTTDLLREMKEKIVTAQGENVDRSKIQTDIDELRNQISSIVSAAQFNGLNLIDGSKPEGIEIVSSLDRSSAGVTSASISVQSQNLSTGSSVAGTGTVLTGYTLEDGAANIETTNATNAYTATIANAAGADETVQFSLNGEVIGSTVLTNGTTVANGQTQVIDFINGLGAGVTAAAGAGAGQVTITNESGTVFDASLENITTGANLTGGDDVLGTGARSQEVAITGTTTGTAEFELFIDGNSVGSTVQIGTGTAQEVARQEIQSYIAGLGRDDISAVVSAGGVTIQNDDKFDAIDFELRALNTAGLSVGAGTNEGTLSPGVKSLRTSSTDSALSAQINLVGTDAGEVLNLSIGGVDLAGTFTTTVANANVADEADNLATYINNNIIGTTLEGQISATANGQNVEIRNLGSANLDLDVTRVTANNGANVDYRILQSDRTDETLVEVGRFIQGNGTPNTSLTATLEARAADIEFDTSRTINEGDSYSVFLRTGTSGDVVEFTTVASAGDTTNDLANNLKSLIDADSRFDVSTQVEASPLNGAGNPTGEVRLRIDALGSQDVFVAFEGRQGGTGGGGLGDLATIDVSTKAAADASLDKIETLIQTSIDAASAFGSSEKRLGIQEEFVKSLVDSMKQGIGALVDTDMEEASARLQALQVQQQLGTQALSIANAAPQNILSLFR